MPLIQSSAFQAEYWFQWINGSMLGREEPSSASRAEDTRVPSGSMRMAVLVLAEVTCPTTANVGVWKSRWYLQSVLTRTPTERSARTNHRLIRSLVIQSCGLAIGLVIAVLCAIRGDWIVTAVVLLLAMWPLTMIVAVVHARRKLRP